MSQLNNFRSIHPVIYVHSPQFSQLDIQNSNAETPRVNANHSKSSTQKKTYHQVANLIRPKLPVLDALSVFHKASNVSNIAELQILRLD